MFAREAAAAATASNMQVLSDTDSGVGSGEGSFGSLVRVATDEVLEEQL